MNKQLIEKVIKSNNESCPSFTYENPILDKNVASALSKSFVKIFNVCNQNSNVNSNLRISVLENIRRMCRVEPNDHVKTDENFTEMLLDVYQENFINSAASDSRSTEKMLDAFLLRKMNGGIQSQFNSSLNPEIIQALSNLNEDGTHCQTVFEDIIHWDTSDAKYKKVLQSMWDNNHLINTTNSQSIIDDISIKMKSDIERILLENCYVCLSSKCVIEIEDLLRADPSFVHLLQTSAKSSACFQICCSVMNHLFVETNFNHLLLSFISAFVNYVKLHSSHVTVSSLYQTHLSFIVVLLDTELNELAETTRNFYIKMTLNHLKSLHQKSETDLIMLLSHFPSWFDIYFPDECLTEIKQD
uniref:Uncharacterized protein n=1 Tax=Pectinophora gossypiella TaxID=13191 RepID=A0A1E1W3L1_PECGO